MMQLMKYTAKIVAKQAKLPYSISGLTDDPIYNINYYGSGIMGNEDAQQSLNQNGLDVFSVESL